MRFARCSITCFTHDLSYGAFATFAVPGINFSVSELSSRSFVLSVEEIGNFELSEAEFAMKAHAAVNFLLVGLNISTLGLFLHSSVTHLSPTYDICLSSGEKIGSGAVTSSIHNEDFSGRTLSSQEVADSLILYGFMAKEENCELVSEYLKGLVHLNAAFPGADFEKDAFANFYRVFEHLATAKVLKKRKLKNELAQLSEVLKGHSVDDSLVEEFRRLYVIRGSQAMHAQLPPVRISREDTLKMKVIADVVAKRYYFRLWSEQGSGS